MSILEYSNIGNYGDSVARTFEVRWKLENRAGSEDKGGLVQRAFTASGKWRCCERHHGIQAPAVSHWPILRLSSARVGVGVMTLRWVDGHRALFSQLHPARVTQQPRPSHKPSLPWVGHAGKLTIRRTVDWYVGQCHKPNEGLADATETSRAIILLFLSHYQYVP